MLNDPIVVADRLTKHFKEVVALSDFSLRVNAGDVVGLLGPNGSGKSTFVRLLMGFLVPTAGQARVMNLDCSGQRVEVHRQVAYLPGDARLFRTMRGRDVFRFFSELHGESFLNRAHEISKRLELDLKRWVAFMSTGMRQKLAIAVVMALDTPLIILDEPTANLDPSVRAEVLSLVDEAKSQGKTILFSSHVLSEIEEVCDRVIILRSGNLVYDQPMTKNTGQYQVNFMAEQSLPATAEPWAEDLSIESHAGNEFRLTFTGDIQPLLAWLSRFSIENLKIQPVSLRTIYDRYHQADT